LVPSIKKGVSRVSCLLRIQFCRIASFRILSRPIEITNLNFATVDRSAKLFSRHDHGIWRRKFCHRIVHWKLSVDFPQQLPHIRVWRASDGFHSGWGGEKLKFWNGPVRAINGQSTISIHHALSVTTTSAASLLSYPTVKGLELNYSPCSNYKLLSINVTVPIDLGISPLEWLF
jgi:hypothetical protein